MPGKPQAKDICRRIAQIRLELEGARGKSAFAKKLGISPSTYDYYEGNRVPPADILVRVADLAGVDLRWLLTGQAGAQKITASHPIVQRVVDMLGNREDSAGPLAAFLDVLGETRHFPPKPRKANTQPAPAAICQLMPSANVDETVGGNTAAGPHETWIPILGRSAAGVPQFWSDQDDEAGLTTLADLIRRHVRRPARHVRSAVAADDQSHGQEDHSVQIISLASPGESNASEFVLAPQLKKKYPDAFAVRIDGESMSPDIRHGDIVVLSPQHRAIDGKPAVVQVRKQIGVTCKLFRRDGGEVHLVPINEQFPPTTIPADRVVWALNVIARVRT